MPRSAFRQLRLLVLAIFLISCSSGLHAPLPGADAPSPSTPDATLGTLAVVPGGVNLAVVSSSDDADQNNSAGNVALANSSLTMGQLSGVARTNGIRFQNVAIPRGATITSAYLDLKASSSASTASTLTIKGEKTPNPVTFAATTNNLSSRPTTTAAATWSMSAWTSGTVYRSPNLVSVVQEIVGQSDWNSGNALALLITGTGTRNASAFNSGAANAPKLVVAYTYDNATVLNRVIAAGADDAEEPIGYAATIGGTVLKQGQFSGNKRIVGLRFAGLIIPTGATIESAIIEFNGAAADSTAASFSVTGEASDSAATYTNGYGKISSRAKTQASVPWAPAAWAAGSLYRTSELKTILQEIVSRPGWASGNAAAFMISSASTSTGLRQAKAFEGGTATAPRLIVRYSTGTVQPPTNPCSTLSGTLPSPWASGDIGTVSAAGKSVAASGVYSACGYGAGLASSSDAFHFVRQPLNGDGTFTARLSSLDAASATASAGIMIREGLTPTSNYAALKVTGNQVSFSSHGQTVSGMANSGLFDGLFDQQAARMRESQSDTSKILDDAFESIASESLSSFDDAFENVLQDGQLSPQDIQLTQPVWLRLTRQDTALRSYRSNDGQTWTPVAAITLPLAQQLYVGLWSTSQGDSSPATATFDNAALGPVIVDPSDPPVATFTATPASGNAPLTVTFDGSTSQRAQSYAWDFNAADGVNAEATGVTATTIYNAPGTYTVTLTVTDVTGQTDQATAQITVADGGEDFVSDLESISIDALKQISLDAIEYGRANPQLTTGQLNNYAVLKISEAAQQQGFRAAQDDNDFLTSFTNLSYAEAEVVKRYPYLAIIAITPTEAAKSLEKQRFPGERDSPQGREDAFRHAHWNAGLVDVFVYTFGIRMSYPDAVEAAQWFADAHDHILFGVPTQDYYAATDLEIIDREMDFHNNAWARAWALQKLPPGLRQPGTFESFYDVLADQLEPIFKDHNQIDPNGPIIVREFPDDDVPQYAIKCSTVTVQRKQVYWCLMPVGYDLRTISIEVRIRDLYDLPKAATVISRIQGVQNSTKVHLREAQWKPHTVEPGTYHAVIEVLDSEGFLILGMQKQFEDTEDSDASYWVPTATFSSNIKKTYDGPVEDCPYLQGTFAIDIKGLFEEPAPTIPIDDQHAVMAINRELIEIYEREDISPAGQKPLIVEAETIPSCNLTEEEHELGFLSSYFDATDTGYTAYIGDSFTNIDNRWPMLAWNRTGVGDPSFCSAFNIDYSLTYLDGRPTEPQVLLSIEPLQNRTFLARFETLYKETYQDSQTGEVLVEGAFEVPWILDAKAELFGVEAWGHSVGYEPGCDSGPPSGRLQQQGVEEPESGSQVFEEATDPWLDRQAPRAGESAW